LEQRSFLPPFPFDLIGLDEIPGGAEPLVGLARDSQPHLAASAHTLRVTGSLWDSTSHAFKGMSASQSFQVSGGPGRPVTHTEAIFNYTHRVTHLKGTVTRAVLGQA
jgi:hypothetical protein